MRFDPSGEQNKLLQTLPTGEIVAVAAAKNLRAMLPRVLAVVRPGASALGMHLNAGGCEVTECPAAEQGMGASLVHALTQMQDARGWVIALADMPHVRTATIAALRDAVEHGADIVAPVYRGRRGNPVAFSRTHLLQLLQLGGDQGARSLLKAHPVVEVPVEDAGVLRDIDTIADLWACTGID